MKSKIALIKRAALLMLLSTLNPQLSTQAQNTAFTYQGRLNDGANPANGRYDLIFQVFDAASAGNSMGGSLTTNGVPITNGLFTVTLDFGSTPFTGPARWLQIRVSTNAVGAFTTLGPRQPLTPAPYATYAYTAGNVTNGAITSAQLAGGAVNTSQLAANAVNSSKIAGGQVVKSLNGLTDSVSLTQGANVTINTVGNSLQISAPAGGLALPFSGSAASSGSIFTLSNSGSGPVGAFLGNVGIGTSTPVSQLHILTAGLSPRVESSGTGGFSAGWDFYQGAVGKGYVGVPDSDVGFAPGELILFGAPGTKVSLWPGGGRAVTIETNGNVGIGTNGPTAKLEVAGDTRISGELNVNSSGSDFVTTSIQARPNDRDALIVFDSSGLNFFRLSLGTPPQLHMDGDAFVFGHAYKSQGGTSWETLSDRRLKQDVRAYEPGLTEVLQLRPVRFRYRDDVKKGLTSAHEEVGFIAQEVREVIPDAVTEDKDGYLMLKADPIHWAAINAIQGLNQKLEERETALRAENAELKKALADLTEKVERLAQPRNEP